MTIIKYLIINKNGSVSVREREPRMAGNEIALKIQLEVPIALFQRPVLEAYMKIPLEAVPKTKISTSITDNVEKIIKEATGLNMVVKVVEQLEEKKKK